MNRVGSWPRAVIGGLLALVGLVWIGQGLGLLPGSFMSGDTTWAVIGAALLVVGLAVAWTGLRREPPPAG